jgi:hypothetical protein
MVGVAASRDLRNFATEGPGPRLRVEFITAGPKRIGHRKGGWAGMVEGFVPVNGRPFPPGIALTESTLGGTQYDSQIQILLHNGDWWIGHQGRWLGYYPGSLLTLMSSSACEAIWYGEVADRTPTDWTWTDMGSGQFGDVNGFGQAAYFRSPYYLDADGVFHWLEDVGAPNIGPVEPHDPACYTMSKMSISNGDASWGRYFYLGGPGGDAPGCD